MVPDVLYERVVEVEERIVLQQDACRLFCDTSTCDGISGEKVRLVTYSWCFIQKELPSALARGM